MLLSFFSGMKTTESMPDRASTVLYQSVSFFLDRQEVTVNSSSVVKVHWFIPLGLGPILFLDSKF